LTAIADWLTGWFAARAPDVVLTRDDNFFERQAIDSLGVIELIEDIEKQFTIRFTDRNFQDRRFSTIAGLTDIITEIKADVGR
jgi:acyl carrier protein